MARTGFFQRRASSRRGVIGGSLVTSVLFAAIHLPLTFNDVQSADQFATNLLLLAAGDRPPTPGRGEVC